MRSFAILSAALLVGCIDSPIKQVGGPGPTQGGTTTPGGTTNNNAPGLFHCDRIQVDGTCVEYSGLGWDEASRDANCGAATLPGGCPLQGTLGGCTVQPGADLELLRWYFEGLYYAEADAESLEADCETNLGFWSQGPMGT